MKEDIIKFVEDFTVELNPKVKKKKYQTFVLIKKIEFLLLIFQKLTKKKFLKLLSLLKVKD